MCWFDKNAAIFLECAGQSSVNSFINIQAQSAGHAYLKVIGYPSLHNNYPYNISLTVSAD